ncbi:hypothetical protein T439DRAFT_176990 [Meredithblackwellia eburnea MCA 4105]
MGGSSPGPLPISPQYFLRTGGSQSRPAHEDTHHRHRPAHQPDIDLSDIENNICSDIENNTGSDTENNAGSVRKSPNAIPHEQGNRGTPFMSTIYPFRPLDLKPSSDIVPLGDDSNSNLRSNGSPEDSTPAFMGATIPRVATQLGPSCWICPHCSDANLEGHCERNGKFFCHKCGWELKSLRAMNDHVKKSKKCDRLHQIRMDYKQSAERLDRLRPITIDDQNPKVEPARDEECLSEGASSSFSPTIQRHNRTQPIARPLRRLQRSQPRRALDLSSQRQTRSPGSAQIFWAFKPEDIEALALPARWPSHVQEAMDEFSQPPSK